MARQAADGASINPLDALASSTEQRSKAFAEYKGALDERDNVLLTVKETSGPHSKSYVFLEEKLKREDDQLLGIKAAVRRPLSRWHVRPVFMLLIGFGLALLEAPANKFLFDVALQSSGIVSYAVSAGVTAFLLFLAHFAGRSIRQIWSDYRHKVIWSNLLVFLLCVGAAGTIIAVLTVARAAFANETGSIGDLMSGIGQNVTGLGPVGALLAALSDTAALVLACINLGGFVTTFVIAFFSHDSDRDFDHAQSDVDRLEKQMDKVHGAYLKNRAAIIKKYTPDLVGAAGKYSSANGRIVALKTRMQMLIEDDDRFVLTDLDQMSEDADRASDPTQGATHAAANAYRPDRVEPNVVDLRRPTGTDPA